MDKLLAAGAIACYMAGIIAVVSGREGMGELLGSLGIVLMAVLMFRDLNC